MRPCAKVPLRIRRRYWPKGHPTSKLGRAHVTGAPEAQEAELATTYVMLADPMSSYVSGTTVAVTGGKPFI